MSTSNFPVSSRLATGSRPVALDLNLDSAPSSPAGSEPGSPVGLMRRPAAAAAAAVPAQHAHYRHGSDELSDFATRAHVAAVLAAGGASSSSAAAAHGPAHLTMPRGTHMVMQDAQMVDLFSLERVDGSMDFKAPLHAAGGHAGAGSGAAPVGALALHDGGRVLGEANFMETPVRWLRNLEAGSLPARVFGFVLKFLVSLVLGVSLIGLIPLLYGAAEYKRQELQPEFKKHIHQETVELNATKARQQETIRIGGHQLRTANERIGALNAQITQLTQQATEGSQSSAQRLLMAEMDKNQAAWAENVKLRTEIQALKVTIANSAGAQDAEKIASLEKRIDALKQGNALLRQQLLAARAPKGGPSASDQEAFLRQTGAVLMNQMEQQERAQGRARMAQARAAAGAGAGAAAPAAGGITEEEYMRGMRAAQARGGQPPKNNEEIAVRIAKELGKSPAEVLAFLNRKE